MLILRFIARHTSKPNVSDLHFVQSKEKAVVPFKDSSTVFVKGQIPIGVNPKEKNLYTVGQTANRVDRILSVKELMYELQGDQVMADKARKETEAGPVKQVLAHNAEPLKAVNF